jgi:hypothetical protein
MWCGRGLSFSMLFSRSSSHPSCDRQLIFWSLAKLLPLAEDFLYLLYVMKRTRSTVRCERLDTIYHYWPIRFLHNVLVLLYIPWCVCSIRDGLEDLRHPPCILLVVSQWDTPAVLVFRPLVQTARAHLVLEDTDTCVRNVAGC